MALCATPIIITITIIVIIIIILTASMYIHNNKKIETKKENSSHSADEPCDVTPAHPTTSHPIIMTMRQERPK